MSNDTHAALSSQNGLSPTDACEIGMLEAEHIKGIFAAIQRLSDDSDITQLCKMGKFWADSVFGYFDCLNSDIGRSMRHE